MDVIVPVREDIVDTGEISALMEDIEDVAREAFTSAGSPTGHPRFVKIIDGNCATIAGVPALGYALFLFTN